MNDIFFSLMLSFFLYFESHMNDDGRTFYAPTCVCVTCLIFSKKKTTQKEGRHSLFCDTSHILTRTHSIQSYQIHIYQNPFFDSHSINRQLITHMSINFHLLLI